MSLIFLQRAFHGKGMKEGTHHVKSASPVHRKTKYFYRNS